jgi:hypothetical protein
MWDPQHFTTPIGLQGLLWGMAVDRNIWLQLVYRPCIYLEILRKMTESQRSRVSEQSPEKGLISGHPKYKTEVL